MSKFAHEFHPHLIGHRIITTVAFFPRWPRRRKLARCPCHEHLASSSDNEINLARGCDQSETLPTFPTPFATPRWRETSSFSRVQSRSAFSSDKLLPECQRLTPLQRIDDVGSSFVARIYSHRVSDRDNAAKRPYYRSPSTGETCSPTTKLFSDATTEAMLNQTSNTGIRKLLVFDSSVAGEEFTRK